MSEIVRNNKLLKVKIGTITRTGISAKRDPGAHTVRKARRETWHGTLLCREEVMRRFRSVSYRELRCALLYSYNSEAATALVVWLCIYAGNWERRKREEGTGDNGIFFLFFEHAARK